MNAPSALMVILLVSWVLVSTAFCLAFLSAAARPAPRMDEQSAFKCAPALRQQPESVSENGQAACRPADATVPSPCQAV